MLWVIWLLGEAKLDNRNLLPCRWQQSERFKVLLTDPTGHCRGCLHCSCWLQQWPAGRFVGWCSHLMEAVSARWAPVQECGHLWLVLEKSPARTCFLCSVVVVTGWGQRACKWSLALLLHSRAIPCVRCTVTSWSLCRTECFGMRLILHTKPHWYITKKIYIFKVLNYFFLLLLLSHQKLLDRRGRADRWKFITLLCMANVDRENNVIYFLSTICVFQGFLSLYGNRIVSHSKFLVWGETEEPVSFIEVENLETLKNQLDKGRLGSIT